MTINAQATESPAIRPARGALSRLVTGLAGSAVLGVLTGLLWAAVAPRATLRESGPGEAMIVNAETHAFIAADAWFCGIAVVAGLLTGILGYRFLVAGRGRAGNGGRAAATAGLILGAVAGALLMMWLGGVIGLSGYDHTLATARGGTMFTGSLTLGAKSALAIWPLLTSAVIFVREWSIQRETASSPR